ncbi:MAG: response regulator [Aggregatilineales bacterium]
MPDIDGREICQQLKTNSTTAHIPITVVTGKIMHGDRKATLSVRFDEYVPKPITGIMLLNTIDRLLEQQNR